VSDEDQDPRVYARIVTHIRTQISDGTLPPGAQIASITVLCTRFGCGPQTAGKALRALAVEGLLVRYPGLGYRVRREGLHGRG
jgi:GntR family transcriptional regulator